MLDDVCCGRFDKTSTFWPLRLDDIHYDSFNKNCSFHQWDSTIYIAVAKYSHTPCRPQAADLLLTTSY